MKLAIAAALLCACQAPHRAAQTDAPPVAPDAAHCDPAQPMTCLDNWVVTCNPDGTYGYSVTDCGDGTCEAGACTRACTADGVDLVYVVDEQLDLLSFDPRKLPNDPFTLIGRLACPTTLPPQPAGATEVTPFSMSVDRDGVAWVEYNSGEVFNVSITDASCTPTAYVPLAEDMKLFGMGFTTDAANATTEKLFIAGGDRNAGPGGRLGYVDTHNAHYDPQIVGPIYELSDLAAELTGVNDGSLFGFFPRNVEIPYVQQLDKANAQAVGDPLPISGSGLGAMVKAWAFAQWGGKFYVFVTTSDGMTDNSTVHVVERTTGNYSVALQNLPYTIVGAGVSTCAPAVLL